MQGAITIGKKMLGNSEVHLHCSMVDTDLDLKRVEIVVMLMVKAMLATFAVSSILKEAVIAGQLSSPTARTLPLTAAAAIASFE